MPYITNSRRGNLDIYTYHGADVRPENAGELNYLFTIIVKDYFKRHGNYQAINDIIGALEGAKLEFYRRVAAPYEDTKIKENGDVY